MGELCMLRAAAVVFLLALLPAHARAEARIALLIGNKDYKPGVGALANPLNDTRIVGDALKACARRSSKNRPTRHGTGRFQRRISRLT
jgi:hypothetical protein